MDFDLEGILGGDTSKADAQKAPARRQKTLAEELNAVKDYAEDILSEKKTLTEVLAEIGESANSSNAASRALEEKRVQDNRLGGLSDTSPRENLGNFQANQSQSLSLLDRFASKCDEVYGGQTSGFAEFLSTVRSSVIGTGLRGPQAEKYGKYIQLRTLAVAARTRDLSGKALNTEILDEGGVLVPDVFVNRLLQRAWNEDALLSRMTTMPIDSSASIKIPRLKEASRKRGFRYGGVNVQWVGEGQPGDESQPKLGVLTLEPHKMMAFVQVTEEMMNSSVVSVAQMLFSLVGRAIVYEITDAVIRGSGAGKPRGILQSGALVTVAAEGGQAAGTIVFDNITKMYAAMIGSDRARGVWLYNQDIEPQLDKLTISGANSGVFPVYLPSGGLADSPFGRLKGRPMIPLEQCSALGQVGDLMFVDPTQYLLGMRRGGVEADMSMHVYFMRDAQCFRFKMHVAGDTWEDTAITADQGNSQRSSFITLAAR